MSLVHDDVTRCVVMWLQLSSDSEESPLARTDIRSSTTHSSCVEFDDNDFVGMSASVCLSGSHSP